MRAAIVVPSLTENILIRALRGCCRLFSQTRALFRARLKFQAAMGELEAASSGGRSLTSLTRPS